MPLRRRVLLAILAVTTIAVLGFALPMSIAVQRLYRSETVTGLQRDAARVAAVVPDTLPGRVSVPSGVGVYDTAGRRVAGTGPGWSALAASGVAGSAIEGADLAVIVPIPSDQRVVGAVRVAVPFRQVTDRVHRAWAGLAVLAAGALGLAVLLARRQSRRLAAPLERLTDQARALGDGDFTVRAGSQSGVLEADAASAALEDTAARLRDLLERERSFTSDVSHQLRTPLTALLTGLESALERPGADLRAALRDALTRGEHLRSTVDDLTSLVRAPGFAAVPVDVAAVLEDVLGRWDEPLAVRRRSLLRSFDPGLPSCLAPPAAVRQILDVLIGNALWHGDGAVTVRSYQAGESVVIDVSDEGDGLDAELPADRAGGHGPHGRGLPLALALASASGCVLELPGAGDKPVFRLVLACAFVSSR
jgi:signal transduction histidine kinase